MPLEPAARISLESEVQSRMNPINYSSHHLLPLVRAAGTFDRLRPSHCLGRPRSSQGLSILAAPKFEKSKHLILLRSK